MKRFAQAIMILGLCVLLMPFVSRAVNSWMKPGPDKLAPGLIIGVGFETVKDSAEVTRVAGKLDEVGADGVTIAVGRPDWVTFPWPAHPETWALSKSSGDDPLASAINELGQNQREQRREVTLVIDTLAPKLIEENPDEAGVDRWGRISGLFPSASALHLGKVGERIVELCGDVASRYQPDRIGLTELILDKTFGDADLSLYREITGEDEWPRNADGEINHQHATIHTFRSEVAAGLVNRCREAAAPHGVEVDTDVRAAWDDPAQDRSDSGHDYELLLKTGNHITVWNYFALNDRPHRVSAELTAGLRAQLGKEKMGNVTMSIGLWADGDGDLALADGQGPDGILDPQPMADAIEASLTHGITRVSVTPASKLSDAHWELLASR